MASTVVALAPLLRRYFPSSWRVWSATALHAAAFTGEETVVKRLLHCGISPEARDVALNSTPLASAADRGELGAARILLDVGADVDARDESGSTALHRAAQFGHTAFVAFLLGHGADIDAADTLLGQTPLFQAAAAGHLDTVKLLVACSANTQVRMRWNATAAVWARRMGELYAASERATAVGISAAAIMECAEYLDSVTAAD